MKLLDQLRQRARPPPRVPHRADRRPLGRAVHPLPRHPPSEHDGGAGGRGVPDPPGRRGPGVGEHPESGAGGPAVPVPRRPWHRLGRLDAVRARRPVRVPTVLSCDGVRALLGAVDQVSKTESYGLMARLMYGAGLRLMECRRLRLRTWTWSGASSASATACLTRDNRLTGRPAGNGTMRKTRRRPAAFGVRAGGAMAGDGPADR
jgi:hypothetical protein